MYSPWISLIKELFVNAKIIIDRFHIVKLFTDIEKKDFELFTFHLSYFKDKVSDRMKTSIDTCFYYLEYIKNSFTYDYSNGPIEGINNFIKVLKRIAFGYRNFANFRTRIFITRNLLAN